MIEWKTKSLGSMCKKIGSGATPTGGEGSYKSEGVSLIRSQNVGDFAFLYKGLAHIDDMQARRLNNVVIERKDTLINISGDSVARVCSVPDDILPARVNQHVAIIRADGIQLENAFAKYVLLAMKEYLLTISEIGATRRALTKEMLENIELTVPSLAEQHAISEVLSSLDDKIDLLTRQNTTLEDLAQTYFRQWFDEEESTDRLGDYIQLFDSKRIPLSAMERDMKKDGTLYPYYGAATIMDYINDYIFDGEYILLGEDGTVETTDGYPVLQYATGKFWCNNHTHVLQAKPPYTNYTLWFCLKRCNISHIVTGAVQPKINQHNLNSLEIPLPSQNVFDKMNKIAETVFDKILANNMQIATLQKLRNTLLPKLINGELVVRRREHEKDI
jgi:type I restriction enzyme S subunit